MADVGQMNRLKVVREAPFGLFLDGGDQGEILLPNKFKPADCKVGDEVEVFIYHDSDDVLTATTQKPRASVGRFVSLKVTAVSGVGAFLDWGLPKDLLVPFPSQKKRMQEGRYYIVYVTLDEQGRVVGSSKIDRFLDIWPVKYQKGQEVELLVAERSDLGFKVIIDNRHWGVVHSADIFQELRVGQYHTGYIKQVREDEKIDVVLRKQGMQKVDDLQQRILDKLASNDGFLPLHDKSSPEEIKRVFGESKKSFKAAIGGLYKQGLIDITPQGIRLRA